MVRVLIPSGALGLGYDKTALKRGIAAKPDIIAIDGGSTDSGPSYLGRGVSKYSRASTKVEWAGLIEARAKAGCPLVIGTAGTCGADSAVDWLVDITREILVETGAMRNVLEIGAGCGYQSAFLASFAERVFAIERLSALANKLRTRLYELKINNVRVRHGDGLKGWEKHAPFDAILVAAAAIGVPDALIEQLAIGGRLVIPVGRSGKQELLLITRTESGVEQRILEHVSFVPLLEGIG